MFIIEASFDCELYSQLQEIEEQVKKTTEAINQAQIEEAQRETNEKNTPPYSGISQIGEIYLDACGYKKGDPFTTSASENSLLIDSKDFSNKSAPMKHFDDSDSNECVLFPKESNEPSQRECDSVYNSTSEGKGSMILEAPPGFSSNSSLSGLGECSLTPTSSDEGDIKGHDKSTQGLSMPFQAKSTTSLLNLDGNIGDLEGGASGPSKGKEIIFAPYRRLVLQPRSSDLPIPSSSSSSTSQQSVTVQQSVAVQQSLGNMKTQISVSNTPHLKNKSKGTVRPIVDKTKNRWLAFDDDEDDEEDEKEEVDVNNTRNKVAKNNSDKESGDIKLALNKSVENQSTKCGKFEEEGGAWTCSICTLINETGESTRCDACGSLRCHPDDTWQLA